MILISTAMIALAFLELWMFWELGNRQGRGASTRPTVRRSARDAIGAPPRASVLHDRVTATQAAYG
jgi:hypothetical protein